jgi:UPF0755 protein
MSATARSAPPPRVRRAPHRRPARGRSPWRWLWLGAAALVLFVASAAAMVFVIASTPAQAEFAIRSGSSLRAAAAQMVEAGVLGRAEPFVWLARLAGRDTAIRAGSYLLAEPLTLWQLLERVTRGDVALERLTLVEGWTLRELRAALAAHAALAQDSAGLDPVALMERLGRSGHPEGWFLPDTYFFAPGSSDLELLGRALRAMERELERAWAARDPGVPLATPYEALILASIVEKETGRADERPLVAAVLANRLRIGMRLQADPTVIYGLGEAFDGNLRRADLVRDTPYNTYTRAGLPPTPIAMPGRAALRATLHPAATRALYFVARGDGSSHFSETLAEHERAVTKYQRLPHAERSAR